jgi:SH3 domain protein
MMSRHTRRTAFLAALILMLTAVILPAGAEQTGVVKGGWLILRSAPSFSGRILSSYPSGSIVSITGKTGSWYSVIAPDGLTGYMLGDYLQVSGGGSSAPSLGTGYVTSANGLNVRLRSGPGKGYSILSTYAPGTQCTILSAGTNWCRIQIGSRVGYMMTQFLTGTPGTSPQTTPVPPASGGSSQVYVTSRNGKGVNLRSGPSKAYPSIGFYSVGTPAVMVTWGSTWSYIRVGYRYGYMMTEFLTQTKPAAQPLLPGGAYVVAANGKNVNLRTQPTTASRIIRSFPVGTYLTVVARGTDWCFIQINGYYGYMMRQFIYESAAPATQTDLTF